MEMFNQPICPFCNPDESKVILANVARFGVGPRQDPDFASK